MLEKPAPNADTLIVPHVDHHATLPGREWISQLSLAPFARRWFLHADRLVVRKHICEIQDLPPALHGLRLVHLTDMHLGRCVPSQYLRDVVEQARALKPDLFVLTGDYVENARSPVERAAHILAPLADISCAPLGAIAVLGNHDWYAGAPRVRTALESCGIRVIDNNRVMLRTPREWHDDVSPERSLCIAGFGDLGHDDTRIDLALRDISPAIPRLVLAHHPDSAELTALTCENPPRIDLMLSGHTHGGQIVLPFIGAAIVPSRFGRKYLGGRVEGPSFPVLVSRGVGATLLPIRLGTPPEISEITLAPRD